MQEEKIEKPLSGWTVFMMFFAFFVLVAGVNAIFITNAMKSHSGVVTENPYEKGLAYNATLEKARNQPKLKQVVTYKDERLKWSLADMSGMPITNANVTAHFIRPVKQGEDFVSSLTHQGSGLYSYMPEFPAKGQWTVKLDAQWDNKQFQTTKNLIVE